MKAPQPDLLKNRAEVEPTEAADVLSSPLARDVDASNERLTDLDSESAEDAEDEWAVEAIEGRKELFSGLRHTLTNRHGSRPRTWLVRPRKCRRSSSDC